MRQGRGYPYTAQHVLLAGPGKESDAMLRGFETVLARLVQPGWWRWQAGTAAASRNSGIPGTSSLLAQLGPENHEWAECQDHCVVVHYRGVVSVVLLDRGCHFIGTGSPFTLTGRHNRLANPQLASIGIPNQAKIQVLALLLGKREQLAADLVGGGPDGSEGLVLLLVDEGGALGHDVRQRRQRLH
jgi:hypothetical protein